eukprot:TRINITY_DN9847_c0_g1_i3.p1 TRINITY_DN9847_c0_g1~~TRINITY_DN9847_c0_g1_i3.p1  ORF type:complete len:111 (+),score=39.90 TRINITY_DN9847_c0_g1_i3:207-539(+)
MFAEIANKIHEKLSSLLKDEKALSTFIDTAYEPIKRTGTIELDEFDKAMDKAFKGAGMEKGIPRKESEKVYAKLNSDKAKVVNKEEFVKKLKQYLEEKNVEMKKMIKEGC